MIIRTGNLLYNLKKVTKVEPNYSFSLIEFIYYKGSEIKPGKSENVHYKTFEKRDAAFAKLCNALAKGDSYVDISEESL